MQKKLTLPIPDDIENNLRADVHLRVVSMFGQNCPPEEQRLRDQLVLLLFNRTQQVESVNHCLLWFQSKHWDQTVKKVQEGCNALPKEFTDWTFLDVCYIISYLHQI